MRKMLRADHLAEILTQRFGVRIQGEAVDESDGKRVSFSPADIPSTQGFTIKVLIGWRSAEAEFFPGTYAAQLLGSMGKASGNQRAAFGVFVQAAINDGARVAFSINNTQTDPLQPANWPAEWRSLSLKMSKVPMLIDGANPEALDALALAWAGRVLGAVLALTPLEAVEPEFIGEAEGGAEQVLVTRYERSRINRAACIEIHGIRCKVCDFDFATMYGPIGEGFIEVHHIEPVSGLGPGTIVDPAKDLAPVCPNCHAMLHRRKPPYGIDELRSMLRPNLLPDASLSSGSTMRR
jgi:5-methylcytosine-specific restriction protein A